MQGYRSPRNHRIVGNLSSARKSAREGEIRMNNICRLCVEERFEALHQLELLSHQQRNAGATLDRSPALGEGHRQRIFVEERIHWLDCFGRLDSAERIELVVTVNRNVDSIAHGVTCVLKATRHASELLGVYGRGVTGCRNT